MHEITQENRTETDVATYIFPSAGVESVGAAGFVLMQST